MSSRRDFMGMALGGFTALGGIGALYAMKKSWDHFQVSNQLVLQH